MRTVGSPGFQPAADPAREVRERFEPWTLRTSSRRRRGIPQPGETCQELSARWFCRVRCPWIQMPERRMPRKIFKIFRVWFCGFAVLHLVLHAKGMPPRSPGWSDDCAAIGSDTLGTQAGRTTTLNGSDNSHRLWHSFRVHDFRALYPGCAADAATRGCGIACPWHAQSDEHHAASAWKELRGNKDLS